MPNRRRDRNHYDEILSKIRIPLDSNGIEESHEHEPATQMSRISNETIDDMNLIDSEDLQTFDDCYDIADNAKDSFCDEPQSYKEALEHVTKILVPLNLSQKQMESVFSVASSISRFNITMTDLKEYSNERFVDSCSPVTNRYCSMCFASLRSVTHRCPNVECDFYSKQCSKGTKWQQTVVTTYSVKDQLRRIMRNQIREIINTHHYHHAVEAGIEENNDLSSFCLSKRYAASIEKEAEFRSKKLKIPVSIAFDGFVPRNASRDELTPLYLRIEGVPRRMKEKEESVVLCSLHIGPGGVTHENADIFVNRLTNELHEMRMKNLEIVFEDEVWFVEFFVICSHIDMKASRQVSSLPNWNCREGCTYCTIVGEKCGTSAVSFLKNEGDQSRSQSEVEFIIKSNRKWNALSKLCSPLAQPMDELHVLGEGVLKRLLNDVIGKTSHLTEFRISARTIKLLDEAISTIMCPPGSNSLFVSLSKLGRLTGSQLKNTAKVVLLCSSLTRIYGDIHSRVFLFCIIVSIDTGMSIKKRSELPFLSQLCSYMRSYMHTRHPNSMTYKTHVFVDHMCELIDEWGNLAETSTSFFEKCHRLLSVSFNQYCTSPEAMGRTFLLNQIVKNEGKPKEDNLIQLNNQVQLRPSFQVTDPSTISTLNAQMPQNFDRCTYWKRMIRGDVLFSSASWNRKKRRGESAVVSVLDGNNFSVGEVVTYVRLEDQLFMLFAPFVIQNPFDALYEEGRRNNIDDNTLDVVWKLKAENVWFHFVNGRLPPILIDVDKIHNKSIIISFHGHSIVYDCCN